MNIYAFLWGSFTVFAVVQAQGPETQTAQDGSAAQTAQVGIESEDSFQQGPVDTPKTTVKYLDFEDILGPIHKRNITRNVTIAPTRPDPRQEPTPEPTLIPTPAPTPALTPDPGPWMTKTIGHDQVKPFAQSEPVTISEKAGVKFKPQIQIRTGCVPYPAVNDIGETSGGLQISGSARGGCRGSGHGSQDSPSSRMGHRHDWEHAIVFIDNPDVAEPKIIGCSVSSHDGYKKYNPCPVWVIDGKSLKVRYKHTWPLNHDLDVTGDAGTFQDLIMWDQMTEDARRALNSVSFGKANTPFNNWHFESKLKKAWPF